MSWHIGTEALQLYTGGNLETTQQYSVEEHLLACEACRSELSVYTDAEALEQTWAAIVVETDAPVPSIIERTLLRFGVKDHIARLLAATPSLRRSWLAAITVVLAIAVWVAHGAEGGYLFFLTVAPILPLAGIAVAFGPGVDPTYEIGIAAPLRSFSLLLIRAAAVLVSTIGLGLAAALFLPDLEWVAAAWLLPSLGLVTASLALSTLFHPVRAAAAVAGTWVVVVALATSAATEHAQMQRLFLGVIQMTFLLITVGGSLFLMMRRDRFETGDQQ